MTAAYTATGETMDLNELNVPGGTGGALGFIVAAVSGAIWFIRKAWRNDKVDGAETQAQIDIIARLSEQVDKANARAPTWQSSAPTLPTRNAMMPTARLGSSRARSRL